MKVPTLQKYNFNIISFLNQSLYEVKEALCINGTETDCTGIDLVNIKGRRLQN